MLQIVDLRLGPGTRLGLDLQLERPVARYLAVGERGRQGLVGAAEYS